MERAAMIKNKIELVRDGEKKVLLTWHKHDESGATIPVAIEYLGQLEPELKERLERVALHPQYASVSGTRKLMQPGTSAHFLELPKALGRLGFRTRLF
jgi:hypothetical protein